MKMLKSKSILSATVLVACIFALSAFASSSPFGNKANVRIPAQKEFILGENQKSAFNAKLENTSDVPCLVYVVDKETNTEVTNFQLDAGASAKAQVKSTEKVLLKNPNNSLLIIKVRFNKTVQGMEYQDLDAYEK